MPTILSSEDFTKHGFEIEKFSESDESLSFFYTKIVGNSKFELTYSKTRNRLRMTESYWEKDTMELPINSCKFDTMVISDKSQLDQLLGMCFDYQIAINPICTGLKEC